MISNSPKFHGKQAIIKKAERLSVKSLGGIG